VCKQVSCALGWAQTRPRFVLLMFQNFDQFLMRFFCKFRFKFKKFSEKSGNIVSSLNKNVYKCATGNCLEVISETGHSPEKFCETGHSPEKFCETGHSPENSCKTGLSPEKFYNIKRNFFFFNETNIVQNRKPYVRYSKKCTEIKFYKVILLILLFLGLLPTVSPQYLCAKVSFVFFATRFTVHSQTQVELNELIKKTTSVSFGKFVFVIEDYIVVSSKIPLIEMTSILDDMRFKLENLQYSSEYENIRPKIVLGVKKEKDYYNVLKDVRVKLTIFSRVLSVSDGSNLCQKLTLPQLSLENIPYSVDETILLNFEVRIENSKIICSSGDKLLRDDTCLNYILQKTTS
jgi:hypothetical protein